MLFKADTLQMSNTATKSTNVDQGFKKWSCWAFCPTRQKMLTASKEGKACLPPGCLQVDTKTIYSTLTRVCTPDRAALGVSTQSTSYRLNPPPPPGYTVSAIIKTHLQFASFTTLPSFITDSDMKPKCPICQTSHCNNPAVHIALRSIPQSTIMRHI